MTPNRTRTGLFETPKSQPKAESGFGGRPMPPEPPPRARVSPSTPRINRASRPTAKSESGSVTPVKTSRGRSPGSVASGDRSPRSVASLDKSPRSVNSKFQQYSYRDSSIADRQDRLVKKSELQEELDAAKEELKSANEHLVDLEREKSQALEELQAARRLADKAFEQLTVAIVAKKEAEEKIEIENFRIVEIEQAGIEAAQQKEDAWKKEVESIREQHAVDVSALLAATQELERLKLELVMTTEAKNAATTHVDDAIKIAEIHAEKAGFLSTEVNRLKTLIDSKLENAAKETAEHARRLEFEIDALRDDLRRAREAEKKLGGMEVLVEALKGQIADAKKAKLDAEALVIELRKKAEILEAKVDEAMKSEQSASRSLVVAEKQLEERNALTKEAESEIVQLKDRVDSLEMEISRYKAVLDESNSRLEAAKGEVSETEKIIPSLKSKMKNLEEEKKQALNHGKEMASRIPSLAEENSKLAHELEILKEEVESRKQATERLASALQEANSEAKESQEEMQRKQAETVDTLCQMDELNMVLRSSEERYKSLLSEAHSEILMLKSIVEGSGIESKSLLASERDMKEDSYMASIKKSGDELSEIKMKMGELALKLEKSEKEAAAAKEERAQLLTRLEEATVEAKSAKEMAEGAVAESQHLKEKLLDKENELQNISQENHELRYRGEVASRKLQELHIMLEKAKTKEVVEKYVLSEENEGHDEASKASEITVNAEVKEDVSKSELRHAVNGDHSIEEQNQREVIELNNHKELSNEVEVMHEEASYQERKEASPEKDAEPVPLISNQSLKPGNHIFDPKVEEMSPSMEHPEKKKKKFLSKFFKNRSHQK